MASYFLLNATKAMVPGQGSPLMIPAGELITDPAVQAAVQSGGGVLWPSNDVTVTAAQVLVQKLRANGADEAITSRAMLAAALNSLSQSDANIGAFSKLAADAAAATATAETPIGAVASAAGGLVTSATFVPGAALTANDTNYATIQIFKRTAGGAAVLIASATTQTAPTGGTGNWTAWQPVPLFVVAGATVTASDSITYAITKTGTGVIVPLGEVLAYAS